MKNEKQVTLSIEQAKLMFDTDSQELKDIALKTFPELNKSKYPMSHDELLDLPDKERRNENRLEQHLAFAQLIALRDKWNEIDEFEPDWSDSKNKYCIILSTNEIIVSTYIYRSRTLSFGKRETAYLFTNTFRNLIEQAKKLI